MQLRVMPTAMWRACVLLGELLLEQRANNVVDAVLCSCNRSGVAMVEVGAGSLRRARSGEDVETLAPIQPLDRKAPELAAHLNPFCLLLLAAEPW